ncbi:MAG TPA: hypothetical protein VNC40_01740 [Gaiellaceae bacterium]|nr:hypothetical protein [Gaiellaceae bacterium]
MTNSAHLRGILIAGGLAALAIVLAFVTLAMNQAPPTAAAHTVLSLKQRHLASATRQKAQAAKPASAKHAATVKAKVAVKPKPVDSNLLAALKAGLPRVIAQALAAAPVAVVELTSPQDPVAALALAEARAGAGLGGASFVQIDVDRSGGAVQVLTRLLGQLPVAPATLVYQRPATLYMTLQGFNDRTVVQQAVANAAQPAAGAA